VCLFSVNSDVIDFIQKPEMKICFDGKNENSAKLSIF
jgi:hypothetical protein